MPAPSGGQLVVGKLFLALVVLAAIFALFRVSPLTAFLAVTPLFILLFPAEWWRVSPSKQKDRWIGRLLGNRLRISFRTLFFRGFLFVFYTGVLCTFGIVLLMGVAVTAALVLLALRFLPNKRELPHSGKLPLPGVLVIFAAVMLFAMGFAAPFRAATVALFFAAGERLGGFFQFITGYDSGAKIDVWIGAAGAVSATVWVFLDAFWRLRQARQVANIPTSTARAAAVGVVELQGKARSVNPNQPIVSLHWDMSTYFQPKQSLRPFWLEDQTGRILVDPRGCRVRAGWVTDIASMFMVREIVIVKRVEYEDSNDSVVKKIKNGDTVYVIGNAQRERGARKPEDGVSGFVVKPLDTPAFDETLWRFFFGPIGLPSGRDVQNIFFMSDTPESSARKHILRGFRTVWALGALWLAVSLWLVWSARHRLENYTTVYVRTPIPGGVYVEDVYRRKETGRE